VFYYIFLRRIVMYAFVETGGRQVKAEPGKEVKVEKLDAEPGQEIALDKVLAVIKEEGSVFGSPYVENVKVSAEVLGSGKGDKVMVFKQKTRKGHRKLRGHRQEFTTLRIKEIQGV
jgi:large subunit ribosomal protein L21